MTYAMHNVDGDSNIRYNIFTGYSQAGEVAVFEAVSRFRRDCKVSAVFHAGEADEDGYFDHPAMTGCRHKSTCSLVIGIFGPL